MVVLKAVPAKADWKSIHQIKAEVYKILGTANCKAIKGFAISLGYLHSSVDMRYKNNWIVLLNALKSRSVAVAIAA
jgi:hypothetical protein